MLPKFDLILNYLIKVILWAKNIVIFIKKLVNNNNKLLLFEFILFI